MTRDLDSYGIWPLTITIDRYSGVYSGGKILAINNEEFPQGVFSGDTECIEFWEGSENRNLIGVGDSIDEAVLDLKKKLKGERR